MDPSLRFSSLCIILLLIYSSSTVNSSPTVLGSISSPEPLPTPVPQILSNESHINEAKHTEAHSDDVNQPLSVPSDNATNKVNTPKTENSSEKLISLEPVNSGEHNEKTEQKSIKKELKDEVKKIANNESKDIDRLPMNTIVKNSTENNSPVKIDLLPSNKTSADEKLILKPGAKKRGFIVFGSLALIVVGYIAYKKYRRRKNHHSSELCFDASDSHFKYDVLHSTEMGDNMEMANVPLTIDSDDDEELEIFDLEGSKHFHKIDDKDVEANGHLFAKDDVEILDLNIPGYSRSAATKGSSQDDDLLNLDEVIDDVLKSSSVRNNSNKNLKTDTNTDLFDIL